MRMDGGWTMVARVEVGGGWWRQTGDGACCVVIDGRLDEVAVVGRAWPVETWASRRQRGKGRGDQTCSALVWLGWSVSPVRLASLEEGPEPSGRSR
jgi:hypothetical protein